MRDQTLLPINPKLRMITAVVLLFVAVALFVSQQAIVLNQKGMQQFARLKTAVKQQLPRLKQNQAVLPIPRCQETAC